MPICISLTWPSITLSHKLLISLQYRPHARTSEETKPLIQSGAHSVSVGKECKERALISTFNSHGHLNFYVGCKSSMDEEHYAMNLLQCSTLTTLQPETQKLEAMDSRLNMGYTIRVLRDDLPLIFCKEMDYSIYREDVVFRDPCNIFEGVDCYRFIFWALRLCGWILFKALLMDVVQMWQPSEHTIMVRWAVLGVPRIPWQNQIRLDGISEYKMDRKGKIYEHKVDNVIVNRPPKWISLTYVHFSGLIASDTTLLAPTLFQEAGGQSPWLCYLMGLQR